MGEKVRIAVPINNEIHCVNIDYNVNEDDNNYIDNEGNYLMTRPQFTVPPKL